MGQCCPRGQCCFAANSLIVSGSLSNPMLGGGELNAMLGVTLQYANFATDEVIIQALFPGFRSIFPLLLSILWIVPCVENVDGQLWELEIKNRKLFFARILHWRNQFCCSGVCIRPFFEQAFFARCWKSHRKNTFPYSITQKRHFPPKNYSNKFNSSRIQRIDS